MKLGLLNLLICFLLSIIISPFIIKFLRRLKFGQSILIYVEKHKEKSGTPTMGGIIFIISTLIGYLIFFRENNILAGKYLYPTGYTGYEQYYIDLEGFWRQLYNPDFKTDDPNLGGDGPIETLIEVNDFGHFDECTDAEVYVYPYFILTVAVAIVCALPIIPKLKSTEITNPKLFKVFDGISYVMSMILFLICFGALAMNSYSPFIYFRF